MNYSMHAIRLMTFFLLGLSINCIGQQIVSPHVSADTLRVTLPIAEKQFLEKNLNLLAERFQVEATKALIIQAKLWNNPNLSGSILILNTSPDGKAADGSTIRGKQKYFDFSRNGEQSYQIGQLLSVAGKKRNGIKVAQANSRLAEDQFYDLIRTLKSQLRTDFYTLFFNQQSLGIYGQEIVALTQTSKAYEELLAKGFIAKKEALRIQAQLFALENEQIALNTQIIQTEADLNILLASNGTYYIPEVDTARLNKLTTSSWTLQQLDDTAYSHRYDLKAAAATVESNEFNLKLQRSLAYPDPTIGYSFDRNGSYVPNSRFLSLGFDVPIFNRNQGNIKNARFTIKTSEAQLANQQKIVEGDVYRAYNAALQNEKMVRSFDPVFSRNYTFLVQEVLKNYQKRNIGLLEFLDYYESFKQNVLQTNTLQLNKINAFEQINFAVGKDVYN